MADRVHQREVEAQQVKTTLTKDFQHRWQKYHSLIKHWIALQIIQAFIT